MNLERLFGGCRRMVHGPALSPPCLRIPKKSNLRQSKCYHMEIFAEEKKGALVSRKWVKRKAPNQAVLQVSDLTVLVRAMKYIDIAICTSVKAETHQHPRGTEH
ncbi:unnamed protein product [Parascedosporium putredinis]|uniref:Uncharacterized protein n=1 Tax=Parascedosporium putredinis TaxID=1442378 RepID=A0A9P1H337_9PEZI|nr:unnamed protein product [Parascedosporium putredinis]CAI7994192.1 unnamed protein product [Parascedosporium putredinis]